MKRRFWPLTTVPSPRDGSDPSDAAPRSGDPDEPTPGPAMSYVLVHTDPAATVPERTGSDRPIGLCGPGWTLLAAQGGGWSWSERLEGRGAAFGAPARVAQAVAVRVLTERGVDVEGWSGGAEDGGGTSFMAMTAAAVTPGR